MGTAKHSTFISAGLVNFHRNKLCFGLSQSKDIKSWFKYFGVCTPPLVRCLGVCKGYFLGLKTSSLRPVNYI